MVFFTFVCLLFIQNSQAQNIKKVYCLPGQGADYRLFDGLILKKGFEKVIIAYDVPKKNETMSEFAARLIPKIDTSEAFILLGVSLGGMLAVELSSILKPERTIIISSAKNKNELPKRYIFQQKLKLYRLVPKKLLKTGAMFLQPLVEPDSKNQRVIFKSMLAAKDPIYLKRTVEMIINWDRTENKSEVYHIHGDADHTIPIRNVKTLNKQISGGSHMMVLSQSEKLNQILFEIL
jgi:pimeloyl-ACP methyl ester carboxylesterase